MKVFLDDLRPTPEGWVRAYWPEEVYALLETGDVTHLSLDHDLGDDSRGTGYDVLLWIEEAVYTRGFTPPEIVLQTANSSARDKISLAIQAIHASNLQEGSDVKFL